MLSRKHTGRHQRFERRDNPAHRQTKAACNFEIRAIGEDGRIEGYGSVFGTEDSYGDIIAAGAFKASIAAHKQAGTMPAMLWQHEADEPCGVWLEMSEDAKGLKVVGQLCLQTTCGREAYALLKMGAVRGLSIGFVSKAWQYDTSTDIRTLTEVDLWEVSLVTFPANKLATVTGVKSSSTNVDDIHAPKDAEHILREAGMSKADALAFVSRVMRLGEERSESAQSATRALWAAQRLTSLLSS